jgi:TrmH family RNA methyltransferase
VHDLPRLTSRRHPVVQRFRHAASKRHGADAVVLDGEHLVDEALRAGIVLDVVLVSDAAPALLGRYRSAARTVYRAARAVLDAASPVRSPTGVVALATWTPAPIARLFATAPALAIGLVDVQDPGNVGGVIRSADALHATGVAGLDGTADPAGWKAMRGAMGSTFRVPVARDGTDAAILAAAKAGARTIATVADGGTPLHEVDLRQSVFVLLGNEGAGLPEDVVQRAGVRVHVPMKSGVSSLNVGVTAALVLYEARRQRGATTT